MCIRDRFAPDAIERLPDGRLRVTLNTEPTNHSRHYLLSFGSDLYVEEPAELREWIHQEAAAMVRRYEEE